MTDSARHPDRPTADLAEKPKHMHRWLPNGTAQVETVLYSPVSVYDHQVVTQTMAIRSCECGAIRRTEVGRKTRWLNR